MMGIIAETKSKHVIKCSTCEVSSVDLLAAPLLLWLSLAFSTTAVNALASVKGTEPFSSDRRTLMALFNRKLIRVPTPFWLPFQMPTEYYCFGSLGIG